MSLLELEDVTASYGYAPVLDGISFGLEANRAVGILGANGAGKTTTLRAISGMVAATGRIRFDGVDIRGMRPDRIARLGIAHVPEGRGTLGGLTVRENLRVGAYLRKDRKRIDERHRVLPRPVPESARAHRVERLGAVRRRAADARGGARVHGASRG